jgi:hypothetical protein
LKWTLDTFATYSKFIDRAYATASLAGRAEILDVLYTYQQVVPEDAMCSAFVRPNITSMSWLVSHGLKLSPDCFIDAAWSGHIGVMQWLKDYGCDMDRSHCLIMAILGGHVECMEWLWDNKYIPQTYLEPDVCSQVISMGHLDMVKWLASKGIYQHHPELSVIATARAASHGDSAILRWFYEEGHSVIPDAYACAVESLDTVKLLRTFGIPWHPDVCAHAIAAGAYDTLLWLRSGDPPCPWNIKSCIMADRRGNAVIKKWLNDNNCPCGSKHAV